MADEEARARLPHLTAVLQRLKDRPGPRSGLPGLVNSSPWFLSMAAAIGVYWREDSLILAVIAYFVASAILSALLTNWDAAKRRPRTEAERRRVAANQTIEELGRKRKLHYHHLPEAGALLDAAAREYLRIQATLASSAWSLAEKDKNWQDIRTRITAAAEEAMDDAFLLAKEFQGKGLGKGLEEPKDLTSALARGEMPEMGLQYVPLVEVVKRLKLVADEIERMTPESSDPASSLESALADLRALHEAESEMSQVVRPS
jgi:uncharacterized membrane-anchored protein YhcB (DUF1043 family)